MTFGAVILVALVLFWIIAYSMARRAWKDELETVLKILEDREEWPGPRQRNERARLYLRRVLGLPTALDGEEKTGGVNP